MGVLVAAVVMPERDEVVLREGAVGTLLVLPGGLASLAFRARDAFVRWLTGEPVDQVDDAPSTPRPTLPARPAAAPAVDTAEPLRADSIVVRYGGVLAVDGVDPVVPAGEIVGLVGPNGAGKTTLFDVLSGQVRPDEGRVLLHGRDVTALPPEARARLRLGRTFQQARLFEDLTVSDARSRRLGQPGRSSPVRAHPARAAPRLGPARAQFPCEGAPCPGRPAPREPALQQPRPLRGWRRTP